VNYEIIYFIRPPHILKTINIILLSKRGERGCIKEGGGIIKDAFPYSKSGGICSLPQD
jgi:hypothetical protein